MARITAGTILRVAVLPGIIPRTRILLSGGFGHISFYMAQLFYAVRLLPAGHPYLSPGHFGQFGISHVTAEAWRTIVQGQRQIDQILIFGLVMLGIGILFLQFCFLGLLLFVQTANALPADGFLNTPFPTTDLAFILMDSVFGIPADSNGVNFFGSCVAQARDCFTDNPYPHPAVAYPLPYHRGLHAMLMVYSIGLLTIAMIIFAYFAVTVLLETAQSGTPFGKRFDHVWAPVRMVVAIALLLPIASGLNAAQYIVLYAAKWGSGFATTGWQLFIDESTGTPAALLGGGDSGLVGLPTAPPVNTFMEFTTILAACKFGEASGVKPRDVKGYLVFPDKMGPESRALIDGITFETALKRANYGDLHYVFGVFEKNAAGEPIHTSYAGQVKPVCGELILKTTDVDDVNSPGSRYILNGYHALIVMMTLDIIGGNDIWGSKGLSLREIGYGYVVRNFPGDIRWDAGSTPVAQNPKYAEAKASDLSNARDYYITEIERLIKEGVTRQLASPAWTQMSKYGWAGAGIWYNTVARLNGNLLAAAYSLPSVRKYPEAMEEVVKQRAMYKQSSSGPERFNPILSNGKTIKFDPPKNQIMAQTMYQAQRAWVGSYTTNPAVGANPFIDTLNALFGTQGLFDLQKNTNTHPLAALVIMGKGLLDSAISNLGSAGAAGVMGGSLNFLKDVQSGTAMINASKLLMSAAMMTLTIGFLLFYVLPFIPFLYFFFAVGGWVKGIFESIVAVPLWALAHIRIDHSGGMPGDAARGGYFMIFEIFLRPILIVFGLLASITIFAAQVRILNEIWPLVTSNVTGYNTTAAQALCPAGPSSCPEGQLGSLSYYRSIVDRFFYTVIYAIVVYMMGMASFKLIDLLPNQILRWLGAEGGAFSDQVGNGPDGMMTKMSLGADRIGSQIGDLGKQGLSAVDKNDRSNLLKGEIS